MPSILQRRKFTKNKKKKEKKKKKKKVPKGEIEIK